MGRSPRIGKSTGATNSPNGRDHWETGFALVAGGGIANGQVVGETDRHADRAKGKPFTPQNLLATLYDLLGIDPATTFPDHTGRPQFLLDDRDRIDDLPVDRREEQWPPTCEDPASCSVPRGDPWTCWWLSAAPRLFADLRADPDALGRLLDACVGLGLLTRDGNHYANTPAA